MADLVMQLAQPAAEILALWGPFAVFAGVVCCMFYTVAFVPGGQPIGALERGAGKVWGVIRKRLRIARPRRPETT